METWYDLQKWEDFNPKVRIPALTIFGGDSTYTV